MLLSGSCLAGWQLETVVDPTDQKAAFIQQHQAYENIHIVCLSAAGSSTMSSSKLSATAAAWVPPPAPAGPGKPVAGTINASQGNQQSTSGCQDDQQQQHQQQWQPATQQQQSLDTQADAEAAAAAWEVEEYPDEDEDDWGGYYDEQGNWVSYEEDYEDHQQQQEPSAMGAEDAVALLHSCYPTHPRALLQQLLQACDGDVQQAARILNDMDFEQRRARIAAAAAAGRAGTTTGSSSSRSSGPAGKKQQGFDYSLEQFPALGGPAPSTAASSSGKQSNWAAITSKPPAPAAAAGSSKPSPFSTTNSSAQRQQGPAVQGAAASAQQRSDAGAEVPWVETGAAVSQEYADARAEASDYARVRNACFQQATLAYMAGNKVRAVGLLVKVCLVGQGAGTR